MRKANKHICNNTAKAYTGMNAMKENTASSAARDWKQLLGRRSRKVSNRKVLDEGQKEPRKRQAESILASSAE